MAPIPRFLDSISTAMPPRALSGAIAHLSLRSLPSLSGSLQPLAREVSSILRRQQILPIPASYAGLNAGPDAGTIVGITLGSVAGFLLILYLLYTCFNMGGGGGGASAIVAEEMISRRSMSPPRPRRSRPARSVARSVSRSETTEVRSPPRRESSRRETIVIEETRRPVEREDDIVEVIEEHSPPPRRVRSQRVSGYRTVDPEAYGGGDRPLRNVRR